MLVTGWRVSLSSSLHRAMSSTCVWRSVVESALAEFIRFVSGISASTFLTQRAIKPLHQPFHVGCISVHANLSVDLLVSCHPRHNNNQSAKIGKLFTARS